MQARLMVEEENRRRRLDELQLKEQAEMREKMKQREGLLDDLVGTAVVIMFLGVQAAGRINPLALKQKATTADLKKPGQKRPTVQPAGEPVQPGKPTYVFVPEAVAQHPPEAPQEFVMPRPIGGKVERTLTVEQKRQQLLACGWKEEYVAVRCIQEAMAGLGLL